MDPIILASSSPRRQEILKLLNIPFVVNPPDIDESISDNIPSEKIPEYLACKKVNAVVRKIAISQETVGWVLGADTVIHFKGKLYGKPDSKESAIQMLKTFQGKSHEVITGLALYNGELHDITTRTNINKIQFSPMSEKEIEWYVNTGEWHGVAGGYRIQGLASCFIKKIDGQESGIMGLPIFELYDMLKEQNYPFIG